MIRNDFILKYIEQLTKVVAKILGLVGEKKEQQALELIDNTLKGLEINKTPKDYYESIADLWKIKGELTKDSLLLNNALNLYLETNKHSGSFSLERNQKIEETKKLLNQITN